MIVPLKKITLICLDRDRTSTIEALRNLGVAHLVPVHAPDEPDLDTLHNRLADCDKALTILRTITPADGTSNPMDPLACINRVLEQSRILGEQAESLAALQADAATARPFGAFNPEVIQSLTAHGLAIHAYRIPDGPPPPVPAGCVTTRLPDSGPEPIMVLVGPSATVLDLPEVPLPRKNVVELDAACRDLEKQMEQSRQNLAELAAMQARLNDWREKGREQECLLSAQAGMGRNEHLAWLQGFVPEDTVPVVHDAARTHGWGLRVEDPADGDRIPTLIRLPRWVRPIQSLFGLIRIFPGYREADVSASFLVFLTLFAAMIMGDAGYGILFLALSLWLGRKFKGRAPREPFILLNIFSIATIVWGILSGVYFGLEQAPFGLGALRVDWLTDNRNVMGLCMFLGAIHLTLAHGWSALRLFPSPQAVAQGGWIAITWTMFFIARLMLLQTPFPTWFIPVSLLGLLAVLVFMTPWSKIKTEWIQHVMLPLTLMSGFGDILSYLRLFALGVASVELAGVFNKIVADLDGNILVRVIAGALILLLGHGLNAILGAMSVFVHGIRLNALEFSMHMGLEWSGTPFTPFARSDQQDRT